MRYWRNRDRFHLGPQANPTLYFDDKKVVKKSSISGLVSKTFDDAKSGGCKKLRNRAAAGFVGLSERNILIETNSKIKYRIHCTVMIFAFRVRIFFQFCYVIWAILCDVAFFHYYE